MKNALRVLVLLLICALAFAARCWKLYEVFVEGRIYFADGDCYSRMTRAARVAEGELVITHHEFENWPAGITPHTTAPLDWLIVGLKGVVDLGMRLFDPAGTSVLRSQTLDLAGALISPVLGVCTCLFLRIWARKRTPPGGGWLIPLFFAISPILVHGTTLGRPDHQSLLLLLIAIACAAELAMTKNMSRTWGVIAGAAWAGALWVSLYEPLILFAIILGFWMLMDAGRLTSRAMRPGWIVFALILAASLLIDGWRLTWPQPELRTYLYHWQHSIGELAHLDLRAPTLYVWLGFAILPAPVLLYLTGRSDRRAWALGGLLVLVLALTIWQTRWGYFLALLFAICLPWMVAAFSRRWIAYTLLVFALWPMAREWDDRLHPTDSHETQAAVRRREQSLLRRVADEMRGPERAPFLAPWWLSPALAYWSGQPGVAGSSHESLPGIVASSRFFLAENPADAATILKDHGIAWVVADEASRIASISGAILGTAPSPKALAQTLAEHPHLAPDFLREHPLPPLPGRHLSDPVFYRLYAVDPAKLPL